LAGLFYILIEETIGDIFVVLKIGEIVISAFIGLIGLGPASRVFTCSLLDRLLPSFNLPTKMPDIVER